MEKDEKIVSKRQGLIRTIVIVVAAVLTLAGVACGIILYSNSTPSKTNKALKLTEQYLANFEFDQAIAQMQYILDINIGNDEVINQIGSEIDKIFQHAVELSENGNRDEAMALLDKIIGISSEAEVILEKKTKAEEEKKSIEKTIAIELGFEAFKNEEYENAYTQFKRAIELGAKEEISPYCEICEAIEAVSKVISSNSYDNIAEFFEGDSGNILKKWILQEGDKQINYHNVDFSIKANDEELFLTKKADTTGTMIFYFAREAYALYLGQTENDIPNGTGKVHIWTKGESFLDAYTYTGTYKNGVSDGIIEYYNPAVDTISLSVSDGSVGYIDIDGEDAILAKKDEGQFYYVTGMECSDGFINGFYLGMPGFGGNIQRLDLKYKEVDVVAPVITIETGYHTEKKISYLTFNETVLEGVKAIDNVDGDISGKIQVRGPYDMCFGSNSNGEYYYLSIVEYYVEDSSKNSTLLEDYIYEYGNNNDGAVYYRVTKEEFQQIYREKTGR